MVCACASAGVFLGHCPGKVPRESLDPIPVVSPSLSYFSCCPQLGSRPETEAGREGVCAGRCLSWAVALGNGERVTIFRELLHVCGEWAIASGQSQEWPLSSSGLGIPVVWHDSMGALSWTRGDWFVLQAIREESVYPQIKCMLFLEESLSC